MNGSTLRLFRILNGLSLHDVAEALDCSPAYVSYLERGKRRITFRIEALLQERFGLDEGKIKELDEIARSLRKTNIVGSIPYSHEWRR
jgi:transcriptional regulator with XRE-family HTH domain